jgi:hypothetical protein
MTALSTDLITVSELAAELSERSSTIRNILNYAELREKARVGATRLFDRDEATRLIRERLAVQRKHHQRKAPA